LSKGSHRRVRQQAQVAIKTNQQKATNVAFWANCSQEPQSNFNLLTEGFSADTAFPYQLIVAIRNCHSQLSFGLS
jgi:hypothetical protein